MVLAWNSSEERGNIRQRQGRGGWAGLGLALCIPFQSAELLRTVKYWLSGIDIWKRTTPLHLSIFPFLFHFPFVSVSPPSSVFWLVPKPNVQNRGSKVSQRTFPFCWCCNSSRAGLTILIAVPSAIDGLTRASPTQPSPGLWQNQDPRDLPCRYRPRLRSHFLSEAKNTYTSRSYLSALTYYALILTDAKTLSKQLHTQTVLTELI